MRRCATKWLSTSRHCPDGIPAQWDMSSTVFLNSMESTEEVSDGLVLREHEEHVRHLASTSSRVRIMNGASGRRSA